MSLTLEEVKHIARLARLELSVEELEKYRDQLSAVLDHFTQLGDLNTEGIPPTFSLLPSEPQLRDDEPRPGLGAEILLRSAPEIEDDQFKVPPILE